MAEAASHNLLRLAVSNRPIVHRVNAGRKPLSQPCLRIVGAIGFGRQRTQGAEPPSSFAHCFCPWNRRFQRCDFRAPARVHHGRYRELQLNVLCTVRRPVVLVAGGADPLSADAVGPSAGDSSAHRHRQQRSRDTLLRMAKVKVIYKLTRPFDSGMSPAVEQIYSTKGIHGVRFQGLTAVEIEYDASRLVAADVDRILQLAGMPGSRRD